MCTAFGTQLLVRWYFENWLNIFLKFSLNSNIRYLKCTSQWGYHVLYVWHMYTHISHTHVCVWYVYIGLCLLNYLTLLYSENFQNPFFYLLECWLHNCYLQRPYCVIAFKNFLFLFNCNLLCTDQPFSLDSPWPDLLQKPFSLNY